MDESPVDLAAESTCYAQLVGFFHPEGLACPRCGHRDGLGVHRRHREPVLDYQCGSCGRVFNAWTGTPLEKTHRPPSHIVRILEGIVRNTPTAQLARELGCQRAQLMLLRRRLVRVARALVSRMRPTNDPSASKPADGEAAAAGAS
jgi:transposase-like protein